MPVSHPKGTTVTPRRQKLLRASVVLASTGEAGVRASRRPGPHIGGDAIGRSDGRSLAQVVRAAQAFRPPRIATVY